MKNERPTIQEYYAEFGKNLKRCMESEKELYSINWCHLGDNFYDYNEERPQIKLDLIKNYKIRQWITKDPRIIICDCEDCCGCGGW